MYRIGVDIGGTFTDFALSSASGGRMAIHKRLTTPHDPSEAVLAGVAALVAESRIEIGSVTDIVHGTTLVTNAVIERRGAVTGMLVTAGFGDIMDMGPERRYDLFDLRIKYPPPLVPRRLRIEVDERVRYDGSIEQPLDEAGVIAAAKKFRELGVEAVAICFLHAYANPAPEERAAEILREAAPEITVSTSADVFPNMREFERWTTTTLNAFTQPMFDRYVKRLEDGLAGAGFGGRLYIMGSSGGTLTTDAARRYPVRALESGPAAGALMSAHHGRALKLPNLLSFDMGGTTAKGALVRGGQAIKKYAMEVARVHEFRQGSGLPIRIPVIDMIEIGAGGGSIAEVDERGLLRVGPRSAGAMPGPACYGRGGTRPTLTDANLVLGYLDADFFLGGKMKLDKAASEKAIAENVGRPLKLETLRAAWGIHDIICEDVARAFRIHATERGFDYRNSSMVAFGGSGPLHALSVARKLKIPRVVLPVGAGVMSALGLLVSPLAFEVARSRRIHVADIDAKDFATTFAALENEAAGYLKRAGVAEADIKIVCHLDMRYQGQGHEIEVTLPSTNDVAGVFADLGELYGRAYEKAYGLRLDEPTEIVNWKVEAVGPTPSIAEGRSGTAAGGADRALKGTRQAYDPVHGGLSAWPVYDRYALAPGAVVQGPALIEEHESTCVIGAGSSVTVDAHFNLIAELSA
ncbi:hydantoinase/oxoprolinase family protein [Hyphomicrobium sp. CS1BSMeth3]|uniref:hydantoinase/oxoprolinase family protein n=1 Tax=Hyphomicrobium sp. CS1BSMeth3 TaxID=1892844 RepID=UPI0009313DAF|nr:hydantoinase/oxoprolinase family protein [Hyphomicrobium sp. CS1BSMeth3]